LCALFQIAFFQRFLHFSSLRFLKFPSHFAKPNSFLVINGQIFVATQKNIKIVIAFRSLRRFEVVFTALKGQ
jgi:hypothetical protein